MIVEIKYKSSREIEEWPNLDPRVQAIALWVAYEMRTLWSYQILVTAIHRTQEEQDAFIKRGLTTSKHSPHMVWRAIDIRLHDLPERERHASILTHAINKMWPRNDGLLTALAHGSGDGYHLHIQVPA